MSAETTASPIIQLLPLGIIIFIIWLISKSRRSKIKGEGFGNAKNILNGYNGQLELYSDYIIIKRKGFVAKLNYGFTNPKGEKTIYLNQITAIQLKKPGITVGYIQFTLPGGIESRGGTFDAASDENSVTFYSGEQYKIASEIKIEKLRSLSSNTFSNVSNADELKKFKQLSDEGVITRGEFEQKKKQLLGL